MQQTSYGVFMSKCLKVLSFCVLIFFFFHLSVKAVPVTGTVSYVYGDDGKGNIKFPAVTWMNQQCEVCEIIEEN